MKKNILVLVSAAVLFAFAGGGFYGGVLYGKTLRMGTRNFTGQMPSGFSSQNRQGGANSGEIISKDEKSITIKLAEGGSKIIFVSDSTQISKNASGTLDDLQAGANVTVQGDSNSDGSMTAKIIQIRPGGLLSGQNQVK